MERSLNTFKGLGLNMNGRSLFISRNVVFSPVVRPERSVDLEMTKTYHRFRLGNQNSNGFVVGLADFACLGFHMYDLSGYPYDDEFSALFSDWSKLGDDVEVGKKKLEETAGQ